MSMSTGSIERAVFEPFRHRLGAVFDRLSTDAKAEKCPWRLAFCALARENTVNKRRKRSKRLGPDIQRFNSIESRSRLAL